MNQIIRIKMVGGTTAEIELPAQRAKAEMLSISGAVANGLPSVLVQAGDADTDTILFVTRNILYASLENVHPS